MKRRKSYAVITGASSGIGKAFAISLAKRGYSLILIARREDKLKEVQHIVEKILPSSAICITLKKDVTKESDCMEIMEYLCDQKVSVFINNAGFGDCSYFLDGEINKELEMIDVNVKAVHLLTKLVLEKFRKQHGGYLLNVASSAGLLPAGPYMATYYATKAYVTSMTRAIARELQEHNSHVYIGCLCPGPVDTEFNQKANVAFSLPGISATECAEYALKEMKLRKVVIIPTFRMKAAVTLQKLLPQDIVIKLTSMQQKKKIYG